MASIPFFEIFLYYSAINYPTRCKRESLAKLKKTSQEIKLKMRKSAKTNQNIRMRTPALIDQKV